MPGEELSEFQRLLQEGGTPEGAAPNPASQFLHDHGLMPQDAAIESMMNRAGEKHNPHGVKISQNGNIFTITDARHLGESATVKVVQRQDGGVSFVYNDRALYNAKDSISSAAQDLIKAGGSPTTNAQFQQGNIQPASIDDVGAKAKALPAARSSAGLGSAQGDDIVQRTKNQVGGGNASARIDLKTTWKHDAQNVPESVAKARQMAHIQGALEHLGIPENERALVAEYTAQDMARSGKTDVTLSQLQRNAKVIELGNQSGIGSNADDLQKPVHERYEPVRHQADVEIVAQKSGLSPEQVMEAARKTTQQNINPALIDAADLGNVHGSANALDELMAKGFEEKTSQPAPGSEPIGPGKPLFSGGTDPTLDPTGEINPDQPRSSTPRGSNLMDFGPSEASLAELNRPRTLAPSQAPAPATTTTTDKPAVTQAILEGTYRGSHSYTVTDEGDIIVSRKDQTYNLTADHQLAQKIAQEQGKNVAVRNVHSDSPSVTIYGADGSSHQVTERAGLSPERALDIEKQTRGVSYDPDAKFSSATITTSSADGHNSTRVAVDGKVYDKVTIAATTPAKTDQALQAIAKDTQRPVYAEVRHPDGKVEGVVYEGGQTHRQEISMGDPATNTIRNAQPVAALPEKPQVTNVMKLEKKVTSASADDGYNSYVTQFDKGTPEQLKQWANDNGLGNNSRVITFGKKNALLISGYDHDINIADKLAPHVSPEQAIELRGPNAAAQPAPAADATPPAPAQPDTQPEAKLKVTGARNEGGSFQVEFEGNPTPEQMGKWANENGVNDGFKPIPKDGKTVLSVSAAAHPDFTEMLGKHVDGKAAANLHGFNSADTTYLKSMAATNDVQAAKDATATPAGAHDPIKPPLAKGPDRTSEFPKTPGPSAAEEAASQARLAKAREQAQQPASTSAETSSPQPIKTPEGPSHTSDTGGLPGAKPAVVTPPNPETNTQPGTTHTANAPEPAAIDKRFGAAMHGVNFAMFAKRVSDYSEGRADGTDLAMAAAPAALSAAEMGLARSSKLAGASRVVNGAAIVVGLGMPLVESWKQQADFEKNGDATGVIVAETRGHYRVAAAGISATAGFVAGTEVPVYGNIAGTVVGGAMGYFADEKANELALNAMYEKDADGKLTANAQALRHEAAVLQGKLDPINAQKAENLLAEANNTVSDYTMGKMSQYIKAHEDNKTLDKLTGFDNHAGAVKDLALKGTITEAQMEQSMGQQQQMLQGQLKGMPVTPIDRATTAKVKELDDRLADMQKFLSDRPVDPNDHEAVARREKMDHKLAEARSRTEPIVRAQELDSQIASKDAATTDIKIARVDQTKEVSQQQVKKIVAEHHLVHDEQTDYVYPMSDPGYAMTQGIQASYPALDKIKSDLQSEKSKQIATAEERMKAGSPPYSEPAANTEILANKKPPEEKKNEAKEAQAAAETKPESKSDKPEPKIATQPKPEEQKPAGPELAKAETEKPKEKAPEIAKQDEQPKTSEVTQAKPELAKAEAEKPKEKEAEDKNKDKQKVAAAENPPQPELTPEQKAQAQAVSSGTVGQLHKGMNSAPAQVADNSGKSRSNSRGLA